MRPHLRPRRTAAFAALGLAGVLAGCTTAADPAGPETAVPEESTGGETTDVGGDCLVGDWIISEDQLQGYYDQLGTETDVDITVTGYTALDFTADSYEYRPQFGIELDISGVAATAQATGSVRGLYSTADGVITTENDVSDIALPVTVDGVAMDGSEFGNELISSQPINSTTYHCEAGAPVIDFLTTSGTYPMALSAG